MHQLKEEHRSIEQRRSRKTAKKELIQSIQEGRGEIPCFQTIREFCDQYDCRWRSDCRPGRM